MGYRELMYRYRHLSERMGARADEQRSSDFYQRMQEVRAGMS